MNQSPQLLLPLNSAELKELEAFLLSDATSDETMLLDSLDGYLTAIAIGPITLPFAQWFAGIWGPDKEAMPKFTSMEQAQRIIDLIVRHFNNIIAVLEEDPEAFEPILDAVETDDGIQYLNGEMWAYGFMDVVNLCLKDWEPLLEDAGGRQALLPIFLLGSDDLSPEQEKMVETVAQCVELSEYIPESVTFIYRFWQPYRFAMHERYTANTALRGGIKIGRNDLCPCGSGKKFNKCCGVAGVLH